MPAIRSYKESDFDACMEIMAGNVPDYFAANEIEDFKAYLQALPGPYLVLEEEGSLMACGGYVIDTEKRAAGLCWGMVSRTHHKRGLGAQLLDVRLDAIRRSGRADTVVIDTSQHSAPFFERFGFKETGCIPDGYGKGLDQIDMTRVLDE
ncbi:MAG: GNAT family N-acetyltransferase [Alphaproteobacteria bacterium]|nr:GNAT family N-acetyltransferase [Alphaproteobacteria bacterium]